MADIFLFIGVFAIALFCILLYVFMKNYTLKYRVLPLMALFLIGVTGIILSFIEY